MKANSPRKFIYSDLVILYKDADVNTVNQFNRVFNDSFQEIIAADCDVDTLYEYKEFYNQNGRHIDIVIINNDTVSSRKLISDIKKINSLQRIILTSLQTNIYNLQPLIKYGIDDYLVKPISCEEYYESLNRIVNDMVMKRQLNMKYQKDKCDACNCSLLLEGDRQLMNISKIFDNVATQCKEPINSMGVLISGMDLYLNNRASIDKNIMSELVNSTKSQMNHIVETLDEFRTFFNDDKSQESFNIKNTFSKVNKLVRHDLSFNNIQLSIDIKNNFIIDGVEKEFENLLVNLITNSKEAFILNKVMNRKIQLEVKILGMNKYIIIEDNAGGVSKEILEKLFKERTSTKDLRIASGIGLKVVSKTLEYMGACIAIENIYFLKNKNKGTRVFLKI